MAKKQKKSIGFHNLIRKVDIFGYPIELNFNHFERTRKSTCGGCCSILMIFILLVYVIQNAEKIKHNNYSIF